jgi:hypothetical protein
MTFGLAPGKLGFKLGEVLVGLQSGTTDTPETISSTQNKLHSLGYVWNPDTLAFEPVTTGGAGIGLEVTVTNLGGGKTIKSAAFSLSATGTVVAAVASKRIKVFAVKLVVSAGMSVNFRDGASTNLEGAMPLMAKGGFTEIVEPPTFLFGTSAGNRLDLVISGTGTASGRVSYWDDDAT